MTKGKIFIFFSIFSLTFFLFYKSLNYYFFQDDWFVLNWVINGNLSSFFAFRTDIIYYRPLSMPLFFKFNYELFRLSPVPYHAFAFLIHFLNVFLVYTLFRLLKISSKTSILICFLYATASFHFVPLSWLSTTSYVLGPTFILLTMIFFLKKKLPIFVMFFILGLLTSELTFTVIPILFILKPSKNTLKSLIAPIAITTIYIFIRMFVFPIPSRGEYSFMASLKTINNLIWYFLWTFNIPEKMNTIIFFATPKSSIAAAAEFAKYLILPIITLSLFSVLILISKTSLKIIAKGLLWFLAGLSPVILLPEHAFSMYLVIASIGLFYIFAISLDKIKNLNNILLIATATIWLGSSFLTISFTRQNHWAVNEQSISKAYINEAIRKNNNPPENAIFIFKPATVQFSKENNFVLVETEKNIYQSLNNQDAIQVVFKNNTLKSVFTNNSHDIEVSGKEIIDISPRTDE